MQKIFKGVSGVFLRVFEESSKGVLKQFRGTFQRVSSKFLGVSSKISRMFQECFKEVLWKCQKVFHGSCKVLKVSWMLHGYFEGISGVSHT